MVHYSDLEKEKPISNLVSAKNLDRKIILVSYICTPLIVCIHVVYTRNLAENLNLEYQSQYLSVRFRIINNTTFDYSQ